jgi:hypothetical protein
MSLPAFPARLTAGSDVSIADALLGLVIVRLTAAFSDPTVAESSIAESMRQALTDNASVNVSTCCAIDLKLIIPAQLRVGRQTRVWSAITVACDGAITGIQREVTKNAVSRRKNYGLETVRSLFLVTPLS